MTSIMATLQCSPASGGDISHSTQKYEKYKQKCTAQHQQHHITVKKVVTVAVEKEKPHLLSYHLMLCIAIVPKAHKL